MWPFTRCAVLRGRPEPGRGDRRPGALFPPAWLAVEVLEDRAQPSTYTVADPGTLGGEYSEGHGLNDRGQVAGIADTAEVTPDGFSVNRAALWDRGGGAPTALGGTFSVARHVNDHGQVTGLGVIGGTLHGFLLTPDDLGGDHGSREGDGDARGSGQRGRVAPQGRGPGWRGCSAVRTR